GTRIRGSLFSSQEVGWMRRSVIVAIASTAIGIPMIGGSGAAGGKDAKAFLTDEQFARLVAEDGKVVSESLAKTMLDKKDARKVQTAALMIAAYGEFTKHPDGTMARV